jgi:hypothetical protein
LLEKLPTREALYRKGVITNNHARCCVFCFQAEEIINHTFLHCRVSVSDSGSNRVYIVVWFQGHLRSNIDIVFFGRCNNHLVLLPKHLERLFLNCKG